MNIRDFIEKFPKCPKCRRAIKNDTIVFAQNVGNFVNKKIVEDKIKIAVEDPLSELKRLDFSVNYLTGDVKTHNATKKTDLDKFQKLSYAFGCECAACGFNDTVGISMIHVGTYSAKDFSFNQFEETSTFTYAVDDIIYTFTNNSMSNKSTLILHKINEGINTTLQLPFIDVGIFDFSDREKMKHKLDNITILA